MAATSSARARGAAGARADLQQLQGAWSTVAGRRRAELLVAGNLFTFRFLDGDIYMGTFELDCSEQPCHMDMRLDEGPVKHKGKFALCIYELEENTLRWCPAEPGADDRLTAFPELDDGNHLCLVFHRDQPGRRP